MDGTLGVGGHTKGILSSHPEIRRAVLIDQDLSAVRAAESIKESSACSKVPVRMDCVHGNFASLDRHLVECGLPGDCCVDGLLLDLGISSVQLDDPERGFSFLRDGPLDMRMNQTSDQKGAADLLRECSEEELGAVLRDFGEETRWRAMAREICRYRESHPLDTVDDLLGALSSFCQFRNRKHHPLTLVFQALRIWVNGELDVLRCVLSKTVRWLRPGGLCVVISFHSLEDRIVKEFVQGCDLVRAKTKKPIVPSEVEKENNRRSRSAKMRVFHKVSRTGDQLQ